VRPVKHRITVLTVPEGTDGKGRRIENVKEIVHALRFRYLKSDTKVVVDTLAPANVTMAEELAVLRKTTIFISVWGGMSFNMLFLPRGAQVILIDDDTVGQSFQEVKFTWSFIGDLDPHTYHFTNKSEYGENRDQPVRPDPERLGEMVDNALYRLRGNA
jgi:hypothetical protein